MQAMTTAGPGSGRHALAVHLLQRDALLESHSSGCSGAQQRLLQLAEAATETGSDAAQRLSWLQLLGAKLRLAADSSSLEAAVSAHLQVLALQLQRGSTRGSDSSSDGDAAGAHAAAYLSLASLLTAADGAACSAQQVRAVNWRSLQDSSLQQLQAAGSSALLGAAAVPERQLPAAACCAAAVAAAPLSAAAWKAFGDMLFSLAAAGEQAPDAAGSSAAAPTQSRTEQQEHEQAQLQLLAAAAEAYCRHLAAAANAQQLPAPEAALGVLLRLLQVVLWHGDALQEQLQQALGRCPAAVWQVRARRR